MQISPQVNPKRTYPVISSPHRLGINMTQSTKCLVIYHSPIIRLLMNNQPSRRLILKWSEIEALSTVALRTSRPDAPDKTSSVMKSPINKRSTNGKRLSITTIGILFNVSMTCASKESAFSDYSDKLSLTLLTLSAVNLHTRNVWMISVIISTDSASSTLILEVRTRQESNCLNVFLSWTKISGKQFSTGKMWLFKRDRHKPCSWNLDGSLVKSRS